ncbi:MAG: metallophosphoesterase [Hyphomicrobium sp.]|jgi:Icc-related predicted phosphoesterase
MKILITADIHYTLKQYDWLMREAGQFDLVIIAGDLLDAFSTVDGRVQIAVVEKYLARLAARTQLIVCSGNHDLDGRDADGERTARWMSKVRATGIPADGDALTIEGNLFSICPWWDGPLAKQRIAAQLERDSKLEHQRWVWIYHAPPIGSRISHEAREFGDAELARWIDQYQPDLVFCGHVHNAPFRPDGSWIDRHGATWIFNAGRQIGEIPTHIMLNTETRSALWFSLAGPEIAQLDQPLAYPIPKLTQAPEWLSSLGQAAGQNQA